MKSKTKKITLYCNVYRPDEDLWHGIYGYKTEGDAITCAGFKCIARAVQLTFTVGQGMERKGKK